MQTVRFDSNRSKVILSRTEAREIFIVKSRIGFESANQASIRLAAKYRISPKAIRDIWKGRSWLDATFDLWIEDDRPPRRVVGRPKGKKDSKPRVKGQVCAVQESHWNTVQRSASESWHPTAFFRTGERNPWSIDTSEDRAACLLPRFGSLMRSIALVSAIHHPYAHQEAYRTPPCAFMGETEFRL
jgi:hypothetical protein